MHTHAGKGVLTQYCERECGILCALILSYGGKWKMGESATTTLSSIFSASRSLKFSRPPSRLFTLPVLGLLLEYTF